MEVKNSLFCLANKLETPLYWYHGQVLDPSFVDTSSTIYYAAYLSKKVLQVALGIILYPTFGALYLVGRVIEWLTLQCTDHRSIHDPASPSATTKYQNIFKQFQRKTEALLHAKTPPPSRELSPPSQATLEVIGQSTKEIYRQNFPSGMTFIRSGLHYCFFYDKTPNVVYKILDRDDGYTEEEANAYVELANQARALCQEKGLFLLQVPQARAIKLPNGIYAVMQEKVRGNFAWNYQRGLYQALIGSSASHPYIKEVYRQMALFIAQFKMTDVKYDNFPLSDQGYVALFDLDSNTGPTGSAAGFLAAGARKENGLLRDIPPAWQREIVDAAKPYLTSMEIERIESRMAHKKAKSEKAWQRIDAYYQFAREHAITTPHQQLTLQHEHLADLSPGDRALAEGIIKRANKRMKGHQDWPSLKMARRVVIGINSGQSLPEEVSNFFPNCYEFDQAVKRVTDHLKKIGAIFSAKVHTGYHYLKVYC